MINAYYQPPQGGWEQQQELLDQLYLKEHPMDNQLAVNQPTNVATAQDSGNSMAMAIVKMAENPNFDVAKLTQLLELQEREMQRQAKIAFSQDFTAMQSSITTVTKAKQGHNYKYATLEDIVDTVRPTLQQYGFAVSFDVETRDNITVTCSLIHKLGHSIKTTMTLRADKSGSKNDVQAIGSSVSYAKRYTISSLLNIATRDDDDAQSSSVNRNQCITTHQVQALERQFVKLPQPMQGQFMAWLENTYQAKGFGELPAQHFNFVLAQINNNVANS